jgi:hypothetical protein
MPEMSQGNSPGLVLLGCNVQMQNTSHKYKIVQMNIIVSGSFKFLLKILQGEKDFFFFSIS